MTLSRTRALTAVGVGLSFALGAVAACGAGETVSSSSGLTGSGGSGASGSAANTGTGAGSTTGSMSTTTGDLFDAGMQNDSGLTEDSACAAESAEAALVKKPVDIIFVIDNSGSMTNEIESVQDNINDSFAQIIDASGIDYRVILVTNHGTLGNESVCIEAPLSGIPANGCSSPPPQPIFNPPIFFQYPVEISSSDSLCDLKSSFDGTQASVGGLEPGGWGSWLREDAFKVFVEMTDDEAGSCDGYLRGPQENPDAADIAAAEAVATQFDTDLTTLSPAQFGTPQDRNYIWHSIVGIEGIDATDATVPWLPTDDYAGSRCVDGSSTAPRIGLNYQAISKLTGGLRFSLCAYDNYDVVFNAIAQGVIEGTKVECEFPVPEPPVGQTLDPDTVVVEYTPNGDGTPQNFTQVDNLAACTSDGFYIENDLIKLCPDTCTTVQADDNAKIVVLFGCENIAN